MNDIGIRISHQQPMSINDILRDIAMEKDKNEKLNKLIEEKNKKVEMPKRYIINKNATILFWDNGEKTIVRKASDDKFNARLGFLTAFFQRYCGMTKNKANKFLADLIIESQEGDNENGSKV